MFPVPACGTTYTADTGTVISPGYPSNYDNNMDCAYVITVDPEHYVTLTFRPEHFGIEGVRERPPPGANYSLPTPTNATIGQTGNENLQTFRHDGVWFVAYSLFCLAYVCFYSWPISSPYNVELHWVPITTTSVATSTHL